MFCCSKFECQILKSISSKPCSDSDAEPEGNADLEPQPAPVAVAAAPDPVPAPAAVAAPVDPPIPYDDIFPRRDQYRDAIVQNVLPRLAQLLRDPTNRLANARDLVNKSLDTCKARGDMFWGEYGVYTRKRSVCDAVLAHYFQDLQAHILAREGGR